MNVKKSDEEIALWEEAVRRGGLQAFGHFRVLLQSDEPWSEDDKQGLLDVLNYTEDHMVEMWALMDEVRVAQGRPTVQGWFKRMTQRICYKVYGV